MKIAVVSDLHYAREKNMTNPERHGELAVVLLREAIDFAHNSIKPDIFLVAGDLVNNPADVDLLSELAEILKGIRVPWIAVPGNHDPEPDKFYSVIPRPAEYVDVKGFRFIAFGYDREIPGWNAHRSEEDIAKISKFNGEFPIVMFQHVPLFKQGRVGCFYNYDNAEEIFANSKNVVLSISGHWHFGYCPSFAAPFASVAVPSLCEDKFAISTIELDDSGKMTQFHVDYLEL